jgi:hypothetical protein
MFEDRLRDAMQRHDIMQNSWKMQCCELIFNILTEVRQKRSYQFQTLFNEILPDLFLTFQKQFFVLLLLLCSSPCFVYPTASFIIYVCHGERFSYRRE